MQIEMTIKGLMVDPITNTPIILLRDSEGQKVLPIWVGIFEANAIALQIENVSPARKESRHLTGKGRRLGPPDVRLWGATIFAGPGTAHALLRELEEEPGPA